jgi:hypothetical protein
MEGVEIGSSFLSEDQEEEEGGEEEGKRDLSLIE